jgi:hypothetical protein
MHVPHWIQALTPTKLFRRKRVDTPQQESTRREPEPRRRAKILIAPTVDAITGAMAKWLTAVASQLDGITALLLGDTASATQVRALLQQHASDPILFVFYGHGEEEALMTDVRLGYLQSVLNPARGRLCEASDFTAATDVLVIAFCCSAANRMAVDLAAICQARFVGFRRKIYFVLGTPEREAAFSAPMRGLVEDVCRSNAMDDLTLQNVRASYLSERRRWIQPSGEQAADTRSHVVAMLLLQHRRALSLI